MIHASGTANTTVRLLPLLTLVVLGFVPAVASAGITARLQHNEIPVDRSTRLMVSLSGTSKSKPDIPEVPGLRFTQTGTSSQMQFVNGEMSSAVTYAFQVQASKTGDYTIPAISVNINGKVESSDPLRLRVVQAVGSAPRSPQRLQPALPSPRGAPQVAPRGAIGREAAFLDLETRKGRLYMGEMVPVAIKAYFREGLGVSVAPPQLTGDAFVLHNLSEDPKQTRVRVGDGVYTMLTWNSAISAIKEGRYPIKAKLDATIQVPTEGRRRSPFGGSLFNDDFFGGSFFNDDFFNRFFGGVEERQIELATKPRRIRVDPLPEKGRPKDFSGAVGQFELSVKATPTEVEVGDPITLEMTVSGRGNFDRVATPSLADDAGWRTYDASDTFKPSDVSGYRGVKRFEQPVVPETPRIKAIPALRFSYFDTRKKQYATLVSKSIPIKVTGAVAAPYVVRSQPRSQGEGAQPGRGAELVPIHLEVGRRTSLEPLITQPWFLGLQGVPLSALLIGLLLYRRHVKVQASPEWVRKKESHRKVSELLRVMDVAVRSRDTAGFVDASQRAAREQLAPLWHLRGEAITLAELNARLPHGYDGIRRVFEAADALAYGGQPFHAGDIEAWHRQVLSELDGLTHQPAGEER